MRGATLKHDIKGLPLTRDSWRRWRKHGFLPSLVEVWDDAEDMGDRGMGITFGTYRAKFVPWQTFRHRFVRCAECGRRMNKATRNGYPRSDKTWHSECMSMGSYRSNELVLLEALDRLLNAYSIETKDQLRSLVDNPFESRDQFLVWYSTMGRVEWYRKLPNEKKWRAPGQRANFWDDPNASDQGVESGDGS